MGSDFCVYYSYNERRFYTKDKAKIMITITHFLIVCPLVFLGGFIDAIAGGGGLISLPAYMIAGLPVHSAIGTNKLSSGMGTSLATWRYAKNGYIKWKPAIACAICAWIASNLGAHLGLLLDDGTFKIILLFVLPLTAFYVFKCKVLDIEREPYSTKKTILISMLVASVIGAYDGFYGPGTGTFLILLLTSVAHMKLSEANGISKVINLTTNISSFTVLFLEGKVFLLLGGIAGLFGIAGNYIGTKLFDRGGVKFVKPAIGTVLVLFFIKIITEL